MLYGLVFMRIWYVWNENFVYILKNVIVDFFFKVLYVIEFCVVSCFVFFIGEIICFIVKNVVRLVV